MNNYGVHLNIVGMRQCMDDILHNVLQPLAMAIYMNDHKDVHSKAKGTNVFVYNRKYLAFKILFLAGIFPDKYCPLQSHHSFTIRYSIGEDTGTLTQDFHKTLNPLQIPQIFPPTAMTAT